MLLNVVNIATNKHDKVCVIFRSMSFVSGKRREVKFLRIENP